MGCVGLTKGADIDETGWPARSGRTSGKPPVPRMTLTVGIPDTFLTAYESKDVRQTLDNLAKALPQYQWRTVPVMTADAASSILRVNPDFLIAPAGFIYELSNFEIGPFSTIAYRKSVPSRSAEASIGSTFWVRKDSQLNELKQLRGRRAAASLPNTVDGWLAANGEIHKNGFNPDHFFGSTHFLNNAYPDVLLALSAGTVDVAIMPVCLMERLEKDHLVDRSAYRVLHDRRTVDEMRLGCCARSTDLYPDVALLATQKAPERVVREVTVALLSEGLQSDSRTNDIHHFEWVTNVSDAQVKRLCRDLKVGPYAYLRDMGLMSIFQRYKTVILFFFGIVGILILNEFRLRRIINKRTNALLKSIQLSESLRREADEARLKLSVFERKTIAEQLSGMIAHEVNTPIGSISAYVKVLSLRLSQLLEKDDPVIMRSMNGIVKEVGRIAEIIARVRRHAKTDGDHSRCDLSRIVQKSVHAFEAESPESRRGLTHVCLCSDTGLCIFADALELELLIVNLLRNGARALNESSQPIHAYEEPLSVTVKNNGDFYELIVSNAGLPVAPDVLEALVRPTSTTARIAGTGNGLGLGLSICRGIAESHGSALQFEANEKGGLSVHVLLKKDVSE